MEAQPETTAMEAQLYRMNAWEGGGYKKNDLPTVWKGRTAVIAESTYGGSLPTDYCYNTEAHARGQAYNFDTKEFVTGSQNHWTKTYHTFFPQEDLSRRDFWDSVLSFNYVNRWVEDRDDKPTTEDMMDSEEAFRQFLRRFRPEYVVILSSRVTDHLIARGILTQDGVAEGARYGTIHLDDMVIKVCGLQHVSAVGASPKRQNEIMHKMEHCPLAVR